MKLTDAIPVVGLVGMVVIVGLLLCLLLTGVLDVTTTDTILHKEITTDKYGSPHLMVFTSSNKYVCANYGIYDNLNVGCVYNFTHTESRVITKINQNLSVGE